MFKHGRRFALITMICLAWALPTRAADLDDYLPSDTEFLLTVNVRQILDSELVKKYVLDLAKAALMDGETQKVLETLGFDPLKDIHSVAIASPGGDERDKGLVIVHGKFNTVKFKAQAKGVEQLKVVKSGKYEFYEVSGLPGSGDVPAFVALLDAKTIVVSPSKRYVVDALDVQAGAKESEPKDSLQELVEDVDDDQSVWVVALGTSLSKSALAKDEKAKELFDKCDSFSAGFTLADDVKFQVNIDAKDAASARDLNKQVNEGIDQAKTLLTILAAQKPEIAPVGDVLNALKVKVKDSSLSVNGLIPADLIEKAVKKNN